MKTSILFVDDEPLVLQGLEDLLFRRRNRWDMVFATGGAAALAIMERQAFDLIVTDMRMPEMDGAELLGVVKDLHPKTVRFILSGHAQMEATLRTVPVAHQFLHKPCDAQIFETAVERACVLKDLLENDDLRSVIGRIQRLPTLPSVYSSLQHALSDDNSSAADIARIIEQDIGTSAKVLHLVNSSFFCLARRIHTIQEAVSYLGYGMIQKLILASEIFASVNTTPRSRSFLNVLRKHSVLTAAIARKILRGNPKEAEEAWAAGLLHDIGKLVLASEIPDLFLTAASQSTLRREPLWQVEKELYGSSHIEVGAYLLGLWGLCPSTIEAIAHHHTSPTTPRDQLDVSKAVYIANLLAHEIDSGQADIDEAFANELGVDGDIESWRCWAQEIIQTKGEYDCN